MRTGGTRTPDAILATRRAALADFYNRYTAENGKPPSDKTILRSVPGIVSPRIVERDLARLRRKRLIQSRRPR